MAFLGVLLDRGYVTLGRFRGAPIRLHWSIVLGMLFVSGLHFLPGAWIGYLVVILLHEMGHALLARRYGLAVREIMIHGMGGHCAYVGYPSPYQQAVIATGGVLAQLGILAIAGPLSLLLPPGPLQQEALLSVLTTSNLFLIAFNLIPIAPLDGHLIVQLPGLYAKELRQQRNRALDRASAERERERLMSRAKNRGQVEGVDEDAVKDLVKRALEDAKRAAKDRTH